jgi:kynurenine formamidase
VTALWDLAADARTIDLAHPYRTGMPQSPNHPPFRMVMERRHGDMVRDDGGSAANEFLTLGGHVGTHIDALAHVSQDGLLYGGVKAADVQSHKGFSKLGADEFKPFVGRAVLLDVAAVHDVPVLPAGYEITVADLESARERAGVTIRPGDAILIGSGWSRRWDETAAFIGQTDGVPGPGEDAGKWLAARQPRIVGAESIAFEHIPAGKGHARLPVHRLMLVENGINIVETMNLAELIDSGHREMLLVLAGLNLAGATGSPVRPLALVPTS